MLLLKLDVGQKRHRDVRRINGARGGADEEVGGEEAKNNYLQKSMYRESARSTVALECSIYT